MRGILSPANFPQTDIVAKDDSDSKIDLFHSHGGRPGPRRAQIVNLDLSTGRRANFGSDESKRIGIASSTQVMALEKF